MGDVGNCSVCSELENAIFRKEQRNCRESLPDLRKIFVILIINEPYDCTKFAILETDLILNQPFPLNRLEVS